MAKKKGITQSQDVEGRFGYGSFLARLATEPFPTLPEAVPLTPEEDAAETMRAWQRVSLPKKVSNLQETVTGLKGELAAMKWASKPGRKCPLWKYVSAVKRKYPKSASDQLFISQRVDVMLENKMKLRDVCPKLWRKVANFPDLLQDALRHPLLKGRVKTFISKAR
jgi:hypothetical protein